MSSPQWSRSRARNDNAQSVPCVFTGKLRLPMWQLKFVRKVLDECRADVRNVYSSSEAGTIALVLDWVTDAESGSCRHPCCSPSVHRQKASVREQN